MQPVAMGEHLRMFTSSLKVVSVLDERRTEAAHRSVLLSAVAVRHDDGDGQVMSRTSQRDRLTVVPPGRSNESVDRFALGQAVDIDQPTAQLERTDRTVVLMLHPDVRAERVAQQWPPNLRR